VEEIAITVSGTKGNGNRGVSTISFNYSAFDMQGTYPSYTTPTNVFPIRRAGPIAVLGRTFFQEAYVAVDFNRGNFSVTQAKFPPFDPPNVINGTGFPPEYLIPLSSRTTYTPIVRDNAWTAGKIAGLTVGMILLVVVLICIWLLARRSARAQKARRLAVADEPAADVLPEYSRDHRTHSDAGIELPPYSAADPNATPRDV
jgi:hypothetical protein